jgi:site-specific DNA-cytosine methylase
MRFLSTFSGIGGLEKGLEDAGWECAGQVELDEACQHWLGVHWPHVPKWRDIKTLTGDAVRARIGHIDALVGGPPCQPASVAGKRRGSSDERWLWPDFLRLGRELSPKWILAENPSGIVTLKPHGLDWILEELEAAGYQSFPVVVGADDVGAPHRRKRVWIVAHRDGGRCEGERSSGILDGERTTCGGDADGCSGAGSVADASRDASGQSTDGGADRERTRAHGHEAMAHASRRGLGADGRPSRDTPHPDFSEPPVGSPTGAGLEGQRPHAGEPQEPEPRHAMRWPSRPGEPQHEWEAPRLAHTHSARRSKAGSGHSLDAGREPQSGCGEGMGDPAGSRLDSGGCLTGREVRYEGWWPEPERRSGSDGMADSPSEPSRRQPLQGTDPRESESPMGGSTDGLSDRLAGFTSAHRREALKALGNAVSPPCAYYLGRAIMSMAKVSA